MLQPLINPGRLREEPTTVDSKSKTRKIAGIILAVSVATMASQGGMAASLISNGSFESANSSPGGFTTLTNGSTAITDWTVGGSSVDYIGTYWQASDGSRSLDMSGNGAGSVSQAVSLIAGQAYELTFDMAGNPDNADKSKDLQVQVSDGLVTQNFNFDATGKTKANMGWLSKSLVFTALATNYTITFKSLEANAYGAALDNVALSAVPLPAAAWLFGTALAGAAGFGRLKKRHGLAKA